MRTGCRVDSSSGFTLIETLLALALSSVLLVIVFDMVNSTLVYHVTGNDQVLASQRVIGVLQDLRSDIQAVEVDPYWEAPPVVANANENASRIETMGLISQLQLTDMQSSAQPIRLAGNQTWLFLTLGHANPRWPGDAEQSQQIVWSIGGQGAITVTTHEQAGRLTNKTVPGLAQAALLRTRLIGINSPASESTAVVAANYLGFRYRADGQWRASWNSTVERRLPEAIEVRLQLLGENEIRTWTMSTAGLVRAGRQVR